MRAERLSLSLHLQQLTELYAQSFTHCVKPVALWFETAKLNYHTLSGFVWLNLWEPPASSCSAAAAGGRSVEAVKMLCPPQFHWSLFTFSGVFWWGRGGRHWCPGAILLPESQAVSQQRRIHGNCFSNPHKHRNTQLGRPKNFPLDVFP